MGFPNVDLYLIDRYAERFAAVKADLDRVVDDLFDDRTDEERQAAREYLTALPVATDLRDRPEGALLLIPGFPLAQLAAPQITVAVLSEAGNDWPLGEGVGNSEAVYGDEAHPDTVTAWDVPHGYWANCSYRTHILADTWWEAVWLSRLCQRAIVESVSAFSARGMAELTLTVNDMALDPQQYPTVTFARALTLSAKVPQQWKVRKPTGTYQTGINKALEGLE